jgi:lipopolysaccharide-binding protein
VFPSPRSFPSVDVFPFTLELFLSRRCVFSYFYHSVFFFIALAVGVDIDYDLTDIKLKHVSIPSSTVKLVPNNKALVTLSDVKATVSMDWSYKATFITGSGSADDELKLDVSFYLQISRDSLGRPFIQVITTPSVDITDATITVHGGASWFYQICVDLFKSKIENSMAGAVASSLGSAINSIAARFSNEIPMSYGVAGLTLNYALTTNPVITNIYGVTTHEGQWSMPSKPAAHCALPPPALPQSYTAVGNGRDVAMCFADTFFTCAADLYFQEGLFSWVITNSTLPSTLPLKFNTSNENVRAIAPALYNKYPNMAFEVGVTATSTPVVTISSAATPISVSMVGNVSINVLTGGGKKALAAIVGFNIKGTGNMSFTPAGWVMGNLGQLVSHAKLTWSDLPGGIPASGIDAMNQLVLSALLRPQLDEWLREGIPVPKVQGLQFVSFAEQYLPHVVCVGTDFTFTG